MTTDSSLVQLMKPKVEAFIFALCGAIFCILLTGIKHVSTLWWFDYLIGCRVCLIALAFAGAIAAYRSRLRNGLSAYFVICAILQSSFSVLECANQIQFYEYIAYFLLLGSLTYHGTLSNWLKRYYPLFLLAELVPLFYKNSKYFGTVGDFAFNLTTTIAIVFVSLMIIRITSARYVALMENLSLKSELLARKEHEREIVESELEQAKATIIQISRNEATVEIAQQVVHDIRSPLSALNMVVGLLEGASEEKRQLMKASIRRINEIADDLLNKSKFAKGAQSQNLLPVTDEVTPVDELIAEVIAEKMIRMAGHPSLILKTAHDRISGSYVKADRKEMARMLSNLIENAMESLPEKVGEILVETRVRDQMLQLTVNDNGCGIPEAIISRLGEKGFSHGKTSLRSGNGLGIYHARKTVESHGGKFFVHSKVGQGTQVLIELPAHYFERRSQIYNDV